MGSNFRLPSISHLLTQIPSEEIIKPGLSSVGSAVSSHNSISITERQQIQRNGNKPQVFHQYHGGQPLAKNMGYQTMFGQSRTGIQDQHHLFAQQSTQQAHQQQDHKQAQMQTQGYANNRGIVEYTIKSGHQLQNDYIATPNINGAASLSTPISPLTPPPSAAMPISTIEVATPSYHRLSSLPHDIERKDISGKNSLAHAKRSISLGNNSVFDTKEANSADNVCSSSVARSLSSGSKADAIDLNAGHDQNSTDVVPCTCSHHRKGQKKMQRQYHIPRPRNAFILFRQHWHQQLFPQERIKQSEKGNGSFKTNSQVSVDIGQRWRSLSSEERQQWLDLAKKEKEEHMKKYPNYKYIPTRREKKSALGNSSTANNDYNGKELCRICSSK